LLVGGERFADTDGGWFWQPTLLSHVSQDNPAVQQEAEGVNPRAQAVSVVCRQRQTLLFIVERLDGQHRSGERFADTDGGWFWQPTLLSHVSQDNPAVQQEIFGGRLRV
jgi:acyl-CoA reductase-like NAD-dependent aldehyde dehydrogenase